MTRSRIRFPQFNRMKTNLILLTLMSLYFGAKSLEFALPDQKIRAPERMPQPIESQNQRILAHIHTDKLIYKPNDVMFVEVFLFDAMTKQPVTQIEGQSLEETLYPAVFTIKDDKDNQVYQDSSNQGANGTLVYTFKVPEEQPGGEYTLEITSYLFPTQQRKIRFRSYGERNLFNTVDFSKDTYSPGDQVLAKLKVRRSDSQKLSQDTVISYSANFEYNSISKQDLKLDVSGELIIEFNIPTNTRQDLLTLVVQVTIPNSFVESSVHSTVIAQEKELTIRFHPEIGFLAANQVNILYFECLSDSQGTDVADFYEGSIISIDQDGKEKIIFDNFQIQPRHQGKGKISSLYIHGNESLIYFMKVKWTKSSQFQKYLLPKIDDSKQALFSVVHPVINPNKNETYIGVLIVEHNDGLSHNYQVNIQQKEKILATYDFKSNKELNHQEIKFPLNELPKEVVNNGGIFQVTMFKKEVELVAGENHTQLVKNGERLIFIRPKEILNVQIEMDRVEFTPGESISFNVNLLNSNPDDAAFYSVVVTDESSFIEAPKRANQPSLLAMVLLENEIYQTYDYLLGVQSWRRYIFVEEDLALLKNRLYSMDEKDPEKLRLQRLLAEKDQPRFYMMKRGGVRQDIKFKNFDNVIAEDAMEIMEMASPAVQDIAFGGAVVNGADSKDDDFVEDSQIQEPSNDTSNEIQTDFMQDIQQNTRNYTHLKSRKQSLNDQRLDFTQTVKFVSAQPFLDQNMISFDLNDQITTFRITVQAFSKSGDKLYIPLYVVNNLDKVLSVNLAIQDTNNAGQKKVRMFTLQPYQSHTEKYLLNTDDRSNDHKQILSVQVSATDSQGIKYEDSLTKFSEILPNGFTQKFSQSGLIGVSQNSEKNLTFKFTLPETYLDKTLKVSAAKIFSEPLDNILAAIESLIQEPYGCFEQCSSVTYPIIMALQFLKKAEQGAKNQTQKDHIKQLMLEANQKLERGYKKLLTYESTNGGYEWFGNNPGHEALSAYGLMQFNDMKKVAPNQVDDSMMTRVQQWLFERRDGKGGFQQSQQALDTFGGAPVNITNAYLVWVLSGLGYKNLTQEIDALQETAKHTDDPYFLALLSGSLINLNKKNIVSQYLDRLAQKQNMTSGAVQGAATSITSSCGQSLLIETTSLSLIAWLKHSRTQYAPNIEKGIKFLISSISDGGRMGSTQSTILSLKALILYMEEYSGIQGKGKFNLYIDQKLVKSLKFDEKQTDNQGSFDFANDIQLFLNNYGSKLREHVIEIKIEELQSYGEVSQDFQLSYTLQIDYLDQHPASAPNPKIEFYLQLKEAASQGLTLGQSTLSTVTQHIEIINTSKEPQGMVVAIISVPSCLKLDVNQFELLKQKGKFDSYEISSDLSQYTLYWTSIKPHDINSKKFNKEADLTLVKQFDSENCQNRASVAYLYYDVENKIWI
eukprot:403377406